MQFLRCNVARPNADVISGILNCVCPECGGRMGGAGKELSPRASVEPIGAQYGSGTGQLALTDDPRGHSD
jgi:hypothetical protein